LIAMTAATNLLDQGITPCSSRIGARAPRPTRALGLIAVALGAGALIGT
jgi:hypothetical protein